MKNIIVINGKGGCGKDTLIKNFTEPHANISSIDPIKEMAMSIKWGWNGEKDEAGRKLLSDFKNALDSYNDFSTNYLLEEVEEFNLSFLDYMFVHIREPKNIEKFKEKVKEQFSIPVLTVLVRSSRTEKTYGNSADDFVEDYSYDIIFYNNGTEEEMGKEFSKTICTANYHLSLLKLERRTREFCRENGNEPYKTSIKPMNYKKDCPYGVVLQLDEDSPIYPSVFPVQPIDVERCARKLYYYAKYSSILGRFYGEFEPERVYLRLVNKEKYKDLEAPSIPCYDLIGLFYYEVGDGDDIVIDKSLMEIWDIDMNTLLEIVKDTKEETFYLSPEMFFDLNCPFYILSNSDLYYGASNILFEDVQQLILSHFKEEVIVIPTSVHEVTLVSKSFLTEDDLSLLKKILVKSNRDYTPSYDFLSNNLYKLNDKGLFLL